MSAFLSLVGARKTSANLRRNGIRKTRRQLIEREECNGWPNQETWIANLWLSNEPDTDSDARAICDPAHGRHAYQNGDLLKAYVESLSERVLERRASMASDMMSCAMARVDWRVIAEHYEER